MHLAKQTDASMSKSMSMSDAAVVAAGDRCNKANHIRHSHGCFCLALALCLSALAVALVDMDMALSRQTGRQASELPRARLAGLQAWWNAVCSFTSHGS